MARSPRTSRKRISKMLSVSVMCVFKNRCRSFIAPTGEFCDHPSKTVQIVGGWKQVSYCRIQHIKRTYWVWINHLYLFLPSLGSITCHPEHTTKHALQPVLHITCFRPLGFREWTGSIKVNEKCNRGWNRYFEKRWYCRVGFCIFMCRLRRII